MRNTIYALTSAIVGEANAIIDEPMSAHTTFRIGGPADLYLVPQNTSGVISLVKLFRRFKYPYTIIGNGSNLLVGDKGIRGAVIEVGRGFDRIHVSDDTIEAESGVLLSRLASSAAGNGLSGLEFAAGIPGTLGGAVYMNAGAYGGEIKDTAVSVTYLDEDCEVQTVPASECDFGYRHSIFSDKDYVILGAKFKLTPSNIEDIKAYMKELTDKRVAKQPLSKPSAGSTFKRPSGYYAAALIEEAGLKGYTVGGASVSEKHSGFVVNNGDATASDVLELIEHIKKTVLDKSGVELETEVKLVGEF